MNDSLKSAVVNLKATAAEKLTQNTRFEFYSHDYKSGYLLVKMLGEDNKNLVVSNDDTVRIFMRVKDNDTYKHLIYKMTVNDNESGIAELEIPPEILGYVGRVECGVYIEFADGKTLDVGYFDFKMRKSMIDGEFKELDTIYVKEFSDALEKIKSIADEYESKYSSAIEEDQAAFNLFLNESKKNMQELLESEGLVTAQDLKKTIGDLNYASTNLWAPEQYRSNAGYINLDGSITPEKWYCYTPHITVGNHTKIIRTVFKVPGRVTGFKFTFYDIGKNVISQSASINANAEGSVIVNIPANAYYVTAYGPGKGTGGKFKVEFGSKPTDYSINPYDIETMFADIKKAVLELSDKVLGGK